MEKQKNKLYKKALKKSPEELIGYLNFRGRGSIVKSKKGKGSYSRKNKKNYIKKFDF